jgi:signal transduction histidine kinase
MNPFVETPSRPPRLALRFAVYSGLALTVACVAMLWVLKDDVETRAEQRAVAQTELVAQATLRRHLRRTDFTRSVEIRRRNALDRVFRDIVVGGFVRATLFDLDGRVTYSTDHRLIGTAGASPVLTTTLRGRPDRSVEHFSGLKVLRTFVPVRTTEGAPPIGALALSQDYRSIDVQIAQTFRHTGVILVLALLALWGSLIPILRKVTAQLHERTRLLEEALTERRRAEEAVLQLAAIVEHSDDAIAGTEVNGTIVSWNPGAERLFGYSAPEMIGRPAAALVPVESVEDHVTRGRRKDGTEVDVSLTVSPIRDADRNVTGTAVIARDITQAKRQQAQLQTLLANERAARTEAESAQRTLAEQNERLRELDRLKDEFISLVSHELRTPLTSIRGYLELLLEGGAGPLSADQARFLGVVDRNSKRLMHLVGDLLFLAQIEAGKLALELTEVDLDEIVSESVEAAKPLADEKGITLSSSVEPVPSMFGDRSRLAQVLDNLVSNALKFTPDGGSVSVRVAAVDGEAVVEVEDDGIGIPTEDQQLLFDRFFRSTEATERAIPGTGLGLTIAKAIVERHDGSIEVESVAGGGTTMRVRLPIAAPKRLAEEVAA